MAQPAPAQASGPRYAPGYWPPSRILMFIACALFIVAALVAAFNWNIGPALAWAFGGFAGIAASWAMP